MFNLKRKQRTIKNSVTYKGNGLHSGLPVTMTMKSAKENSGIIFIRTDLEEKPQIYAHIKNVTNTNRATTLEQNGGKVFTVEHVLSALYAMHIDNCIIEMDSPEPPVGDGSARTFVDMINDAQIIEQNAEKEIFELPHSVSFYDNNKFIIATPYKGLRITFTSINPHPMLGTQIFDIEITPETYDKEIASARTIGFTSELEAMKKMGLGKGGTLENAVVYSKDGCLSIPRYKDELVRHKILDILGDISLVGPISAHIIAVLGSHKLNAALSQKLESLKNISAED